MQIRKLRIVAVVLALSLFHRGAPAQDAAVDQSGFVGMLNAARAQRGLAPVAYDPNAAATAYRNNQAQLVYGLGHHTLNGYGQVAAVGMADAASALAAWTNSPAHAGLIFAPDLVAIGFSQLGGACTAATVQSFANYWPTATYYPATWSYPMQWYYPAQRR